MIPIRVAVAIAWVASTGACGDPANEPEFEGEALDEVTCIVSGTDYHPTPGTRLQVALLWQTPDGGYAPNDRGSDIAASFPASAAVHIFEPPDASFAQSRAGVVGQLAIGTLAAFEDADGDQIWDPSEPFIGMSADLVVVFTKTGVAGQPTGALAPGFHHVTPNGCSDPTLPRFESALDDTCHIALSDKTVLRFELTCAPAATGPCVDLAAVRQACRADPDDPRCATCAKGIFPKGATPAECDLWRDACLTEFLPGVCGSEWKICNSGEDDPAPECDRECVCGPIYDQCIKAGGSSEDCTAKSDACFDGNS